MVDALSELWPLVVAVADVLVSAVAAAHAVMYKRDSRSALGWAGIIWLAPFLGALLYVLFGVNRIRRRAQSLRAEPWGPAISTEFAGAQADLERCLQCPAVHFDQLRHLVNRLVHRPLVVGNRVKPLFNGDQAFPDMLEAIHSAERTLSLATYIFDDDEVGQEFAAALEQACKRGVAVRVLIDDVGARYSWPSIVHRLKHHGVPVARFIPTLVPWMLHYTNLRNHRKILVADGRIGFTGGMNIRAGCMLGRKPKHPLQDLHFRVEGPVVAQLQEVFASDWHFCTGETLEGEAWFPPLQPVGPLLARGISAGPDEDIDKLRIILEGALAVAQRSITIVTPYFLPDQPLIDALNCAALRGVDVHIVLPRVNNLVLVQWASMAELWQVLEHGCRVWLSPPPFDHSKLMVVDGTWVLLGSANWDPRSLRLNFEFNVECYSPELAAQLEEHVRAKMAQSREVTLADVDSRPIAVRLRDGLARLASPYL